MARALNRSRSPASSVDSDKPAVRAPGASRVGGTGSKTPKAQAPAPGLATPGASSSTGPLGGGIHLTEDDDPDAFPLPNANDVEPFPTHLIPWYQKQAVAGPTECSPSSAPPALLAGPAGNAPPPIDAMLAEITSTLASVAQSPVVAMSVISAFAERERRLQRAGLRPDRKLGKGVDVKSLSEQEKRDRMERVVSQHGRALTFVEEKADAGERLSVALIKECHGILCEGLMAEGQVAGEFRKSGARAGATGFPAHTRVDKLMDVTISIYNRMEESEIYSPFARASWLVCQFITIHPFSDGNGRASRLLLIYALRRSIPWSFTGSPVWNALMGLSGKVLPGGIPDDFESYITGVPFAISITNSEAHRDHYVAAIKASRPWADSAPRGEAVLVRRTGFLAHIVLHQTWIRCRVVAGMMAERHLEEALGVVPPTVNAHVGEGLGRERSPARSSGSGKGKNKRDHLDMADGDEDADEGSATRRRLSPGLGPPKAKKKGNLGHDSDDDDGDEPGGRKRWKGKERVTEAAAAKVAAPAPAPVKEPEVPKQMTAEEERAQTCVVCMDGEVQVRTTCCRQFYHLQCLFKWSVSNPTCPSCRHSLTMERQGMTRDELVRDAAAALQVLFDAAGAMRAVGDALPVDDTSLSTTESEDDDGDNTSTTDVIEDPLAIEDESTLVDNVIVVDDTETSEVVFDEDDTTETVDAADESTSTTSEAVDDTTESITAAIPVPEPQDTVNLSAYRGRNVPSWIPEKRCPYCNRRFHSADDLQDHLRHTTTHDIWTCCGKIFLSGSAFSNHHRAVHDQTQACSIPGLSVFGQVLAFVTWVSVLLGIAVVYLNLQLRRERVRRQHEREDQRAGERGEQPLRMAQPKMRLSQFENFLILLTVSCALGSCGITLAAFVNITSMLFYILMSTRNILLIASVMIYVDLTLRAVDDSQMARLRSMQVILLSPLLALVFALFLYQGHLSDYMHYTDDSQATINWFNMIVLVNTALWYICFLMLGVFVLVGRRKFAKYLIGLEAQAYVAGSTSGGNSTSGTHGTSGLGRFGWRQQQTDSKESGSNNPQKKLIKVIKGAIATMWWIALWIGVFLVYSVIFAFSVLYFGDADVIYFLTLAINWCGPSFYAVAIFIFFFVRTASQYRELREEVSDAEGSGAGASSFSIGWRPSLDDGPISGATSPSLLPGVVNASRMESPPARPGSANMHPMQTFEPAARPPLNSSAGASEWRGSGR